MLKEPVERKPHPVGAAAPRAQEQRLRAHHATDRSGHRAHRLARLALGAVRDVALLGAAAFERSQRARHDARVDVKPLGACLKEHLQARGGHEGRRRARRLDAGLARVVPAAHLGDLGALHGVEVPAQRAVDVLLHSRRHGLRGTQGEQESRAVAVAPPAHVVTGVVVGVHERLADAGAHELARAPDRRLPRTVRGIARHAHQALADDAGAADPVSDRDLAADAIDALVGPLRARFAFLRGDEELHALVHGASKRVRVRRSGGTRDRRRRRRGPVGRRRIHGQRQDQGRDRDHHHPCASGESVAPDAASGATPASAT